MAKPRLDLHWWKRNRPESLGDGAVTAVLDDFAKISKSLEKSHDYAQLFKAVSRLKSAIAKDSQTLRKLNDKQGLKVLAELEKLAHAKATSKQRHLTLRKIAATGLSSTAGERVKVSDSGTADLSAIVNPGNRNWQLLKSNKVVSAKSKSCAALPKTLPKTFPERELGEWKKEGVSWSCTVENDSNASVVTLSLQLQYEWNGRHPQSGGAFIKNCGVWVTDARILGGCTVEANVEIGRPMNAGSRTAPIGAIPLEVNLQVVTPLDKLSKTWNITCHGNKKREVK